MGKILNFEEFLKKKQKERFVEVALAGLTNLYEGASQISEEYMSEINTDPVNAIKKFKEYTERIRDLSPNRYMGEALGGGPDPASMGHLFNVIGSIYQDLTREQRTEALKYILNYLDGLNYFNSQQHVSEINDSWLFGDIVISRGIYWPGCSEYCRWLSGTWNDFLQTHQEKVRSYALLGIATTFIESSLDCRVGFRRDFPVLNDRVLDAVTGQVEVYSNRMVERERVSKEEALDYYLAHKDPLLYDAIFKKIKEQKWICLI